MAQQIVTFYVGEDAEQLRERLQKVADDKSRSLSFVIREALDDYLARCEASDNGKGG